MAQQLFQSMLRLLASGRHYSPGSAIAISVFAFNENQSVSPGVWKGDDGKLNLALVASATSYERSRDNVDMTFAKDFVSAAYQYLQARVLEGSGVDRSDLPALYTNYFLEQKVKAYSQRYRLDPEAQWLRYETAIIALARQAGGTERDFTLLAEAAQMISSPQSSPSDMEESALARAAEEKDPRKKTGLLVRGILYLLREKRFSAAEQSAELLEDVNIRNQMIQVVRVAALKDAIETRRWNEVSQKLDKIDDRTMKLYLLLEAGRVIGSSKPDREVALRYLSDARKLLGSLDNALQKAAGAVAALALTQRTDPAFGQIALNDLSTIINGAEKYQGQNYFAVLRLPANNSEFGYKLKEIGFEECFAHAGRQDWIGADLAARNLENKYLRAWARLAAAKALLEKKDSPSVTEMSH